MPPPGSQLAGHQYTATHTFTAERRDFWLAILPGLTRGLKCEILETNGQEDHIHLLLRFPPTAVLSDVIGALKSKGASDLLDRFGSFYCGRH
jgi:REP element-mobilizing transposase RayT